MALNSHIIPHLWFDKEAIEAAQFYVSVFPESKITNTTTVKNTPSGDVDTVSFEIWGHPFMGISAGPMFIFNPSVSFMVNVDPTRESNAREMIDTIWAKLSEGGKPLMPLDKYPFSEWYGWIEDKYGVSWQLILSNPEGDPRPPIVPSLLFVSNRCELAEEATNFYISVFKYSERGLMARYPKGMEPNKEGAVMFTDFKLENQWLAAMDTCSSLHNFAFNEAISFIIYCETQADIDYYWDKLSAFPEVEQCGWIKDKYGVSWQVVPAVMDEMMREGSSDQVNRVTQTFLPMKKLDIKKIEEAYHSK